MFFTSYLLCSLRLLKLKTWRTNNKNREPHQRNAKLKLKFSLSWFNKIRLWTTRPRKTVLSMGFKVSGCSGDTSSWVGSLKITKKRNPFICCKYHSQDVYSPQPKLKVNNSSVCDFKLNNDALNHSPLFCLQVYIVHVGLVCSLCSKVELYYNSSFLQSTENVYWA